MTKTKIKALKRAYQEHADAEDTFFPSKRDFLYWFTFINSAVFEGCLKRPDLEIARLRGMIGQAVGDIETGKTLIRLKDRFTDKKTRTITASSKQMFINTVAHEMVHCLEFQIHGTMKHGEFYKIWKKKFKEMDITL